ncbi:hypothetical protein [Celerinatantimonas sp. MCCC 1A17872]|uniref:hypothetical protein n=1 Tax=Celerinatantimonas sp. MCCC 1A17872 TaxID=3177514 RepID=UPI0038C7498F
MLEHQTQRERVRGGILTIQQTKWRVSLTFIKDENLCNGYGVSRELVRSEYSESKKQEFLEHSFGML